jgi:membrane fusion protein
MKPSLFRPEVLEARRQSLQGGVLIAATPSLRLLVALAVGIAGALAAYACWGEYTRKEHVGGYLAPTLGLIKIHTPQAGRVLERRVAEGQRVRQGEVLLVISSERATESTAETGAAMLRELARRRDSLERERAKQAEIDRLGAGGLAERIRGLQAEIAQAGSQRELQRSRVASAERTVARNRALVAARFLSPAAMQQSEEALLDQRGQLAALERSITGLQRELDAAEVEMAASGLRRANNSAGLERQISELEQQLTEGAARREVVLTAPADGTVTTVLAESGQTVTPAQPLLSILPAGAALEARLLVPTRAAGFIRVGQEVALRYQAFPYQRFGHHLGQVREVGLTVIQADEVSLPLPVREPVYLVTVRLPSQAVRAYGQSLALQAGMVVDADVRIDRRRLVEWLFDPLLSVAGRV